MKNLFKLAVLFMFALALMAFGPPADEDVLKIPDGYTLEVAQYNAVDLDNVAILDEIDSPQVEERTLNGTVTMVSETQNSPVKSESVVLQTYTSEFTNDNLKEISAAENLVEELNCIASTHFRKVKIHSSGRNIDLDNEICNFIEVVYLL